MFDLSIRKQDLLTPLLTVAGAVDRKQSLAILANILIELKENVLKLTATDLEIEISANIPCLANEQNGAITVPAKKMVDIIRSLDDDAEPKLSYKEGVVTIHQGRSRFKLNTLPAESYPNSEDEVSDLEFTLSRKELVHLFQSTHFAMSQQDVRIFLNGLLFELDGQQVNAVATDGHRMAICRLPKTLEGQSQKFLLPRKGIQEMLRLLNTIDDESISICAGKNHFRMTTGQFVFSSKLIEARFPPYTKAIPKVQDKSVVIDCDIFKRALSRIIILANEKSRAVLMHMQTAQLTLIANNQEQDEAMESIEAETEGDELKIGINASYMLDVLNFISQGQIRLSMSNSESSILVESLKDEHYQYVLMPMKI